MEKQQQAAFKILIASRRRRIDAMEREWAQQKQNLTQLEQALLEQQNKLQSHQAEQVAHEERLNQQIVQQQGLGVAWLEAWRTQQQALEALEQQLRSELAQSQQRITQQQHALAQLRQKIAKSQMQIEHYDEKLQQAQVHFQAQEADRLDEAAQEAFVQKARF